MNSTCKLIDMTVPSDRNIALKEMEKKGKYKDLELEIQRMWHTKTVVIPCGCWCTWYSKEGDGRKHQESIIGSYCDRDPKDLPTGICANPQKGPQCMNRMIDLSDWCCRCIVCARLMHEKNTSKDYHRRDNNLFNYLFIYYNLMANNSKCTHRQSPKDNL